MEKKVAKAREKEFVREEVNLCMCEQRPAVETISIPGAYNYRYGCADFCTKCGMPIRERYYD